MVSKANVLCAWGSPWAARSTLLSSTCFGSRGGVARGEGKRRALFIVLPKASVLCALSGMWAARFTLLSSTCFGSRGGVERAEEGRCMIIVASKRAWGGTSIRVVR